MKFDAIILAAGRGKRMKPFSDVISKPMLPILNKPLLAIITEQLLAIGAQNVIITVSKSNEEEIKKCFNLQPYAEKIIFCVQEPPQGTADAIYKAGLLTKEQTVLSMAGDNLFSEKFCKELVNAYFKTKDTVHCIMTLLDVTREEITKLASVTLDSQGFITSIVEKPKLDSVESTLASLSVYILDRKLLDYFGSVPLSLRGEYEAPDAFLAMLQSGNVKIKGLVTIEKYLHISNPIDLWKYNMDYLGEKETEISASAIVGKNVELKKTIIGNDTIIGENSYLEACVVLQGTKIPPNTKLKKAVIGNNTTNMQIYHIQEKDD